MSLHKWIKENKTTILIFSVVLLIDQLIEYLWFKPLYPGEAGAIAEKIFWATFFLGVLSFVLYQIVNINWHKR
jgi:hypothetical protein